MLASWLGLSSEWRFRLAMRVHHYIAHRRNYASNTCYAPCPKMNFPPSSFLFKLWCKKHPTKKDLILTMNIPGGHTWESFRLTNPPIYRLSLLYELCIIHIISAFWGTTQIKIWPLLLFCMWNKSFHIEERNFHVSCLSSIQNKVGTSSSPLGPTFPQNISWEDFWGPLGHLKLIYLVDAASWQDNIETWGGHIGKWMKKGQEVSRSWYWSGSRQPRDANWPQLSQ